MLCIPLTSISIIWIASIVLLLDLIIVPVAIALVGATSDETIEVVDSFAWTYSWWSYAAIPLLVILFPHAGVQLLDWAIAAGVRREQVEFTMGTWCYCTLDERRMCAEAHISRLTSGAARKQYMEIGGLSEDEIEVVTRDWKNWAENEVGVHASMHGQLLINL